MSTKPPNFFQLVYKSLILDSNTYYFVKENSNYLIYCGLIVVLGSLAAGFGTFSFTNQASIFKQIVSSIFGWFFLSFLIFIIGTKIFKYKSDYKTILRTLGLAYSPMLLNILAFSPYFGDFVIIISSIWLFFTTVYAVIHSLESSKLISLLIIILALIPYITIIFGIVR